MSLRHVILRWIITAIAILVTTALIPGISISGNGLIVAFAVAIILGLVNAIIRPILILLSCGCILATLGLFMLVINAAALWIASEISRVLGIGFTVSGIVPALLGSIVISVVSWLLSVLLIGDQERRK